MKDAAVILLGLPWTLALTAVALTAGAVLGLPLLFARQSGSLVLRTGAMGLITVLRSIPPLVWLFIIYFGIGTDFVRLSSFASAAIGMSLIAGANMAEIYRGGLIAVHHGQWEATAALGMKRRHAIIDVIAPQTFRVALPTIGSYAIGLLKDSAIASTIGVAELVFQANQQTQITQRALAIYTIVGAVYIVISLPIAGLSRWADLKLRTVVAR